MPRCRHWNDELPEDCPPTVTSCRSYANWRARQAGDMLPEDAAIDLQLIWGLCALDVGIRDGLEMPPELD